MQTPVHTSTAAPHNAPHVALVAVHPALHTSISI
jgi:hypothetical protein